MKKLCNRCNEYRNMDYEFGKDKKTCLFCKEIENEIPRADGQWGVANLLNLLSYLMLQCFSENKDVATDSHYNTAGNKPKNYSKDNGNK